MKTNPPPLFFNEASNKNSLIAEGGEGKIYKYGNLHLVKIFKKCVNKVAKLGKIERLMSLPLPSSVVKPNVITTDSNGKFTGYSMERVDGEEFRILSSKKYVKANDISKKIVLQMLLEIAGTLDVLHRENIYVGDLSDLNILFDSNYKIHFIDVDSWAIGNYTCDVANESFKDPNLIKNLFNSSTDLYAFAILAYKALTRLHPFAGVYVPNESMSLEERMRRGISVIGNKKVVVPSMTDSDSFLPTKFLRSLNEIFTTGRRHSIYPELLDFCGHLKLCPNHGDYYYSLYDKCPVCEVGSKEVAQMTNVGTVGGVQVRVLFQSPQVAIMFSELTYLTTDRRVAFRNSKRTFPFVGRIRYNVNLAGDVFYKESKERVQVTTDARTFEIEKKFGSLVAVRDNDLYYVTDGLQLTRFSLVNSETCFASKLEEVGINSVFDVFSSDNYFVCNSYDNSRFASVSGHHYEIPNSEKIVDYGIHADPESIGWFDSTSPGWLFAFETASGKFVTLAMDKQRGIVFQREDIRYEGSLANICYQNGFVYKPSNGKIVRYNCKTGESKNFVIPQVTPGTKLLKRKNKFIAIAENKIYEIG